MFEPECLDIFVNANSYSIATLLQDVKIRSGVILHEPTIISARYGVAAHYFPFKFIDITDANYNGKKNHIVLDTTDSSRMLRPIWNKKTDDLNKIIGSNSDRLNQKNYSWKIPREVLRSLIGKHINVHAEYFQDNNTENKSICVYGISDGYDLKWSAKICLNIEKESNEYLLRNRLVVPAIIKDEPVFRLDTSILTHQVNFSYIKDSSYNYSSKQGHSLVDDFLFGGFMNLFNVRKAEDLVGKIVSVYLAPPKNNKNVVLGIGSYEQYREKYPDSSMSMNIR